MSRKLIFLLLVIMFAVFINKTSHASEDSIAFQNLNEGCPESLEAFAEIVDCFELYSSMFNDVLATGDYYLIPKHGKTSEMAVEYLSKGFQYDLALAIVSTFLDWDPQSGTMFIIPCDGIPILTDSDFDETQYYMQNNEKIIFQRHYYNCYSEKDHYCFQVHGILTDTGWKIAGLSLEAIKLIDANSESCP